MKSMHVSIIGMLLCVLAGCHLVGTYDATIDQKTSALQCDMDETFLNLATDSGTPKAAYTNYYKQYNNYRSRINALKIRATIIPHDELTLKQLTDLDANLTLLEQLHKNSGKNGLKPQMLVPIESSFDSIFGAILKLEMSKEKYVTSQP